MRSKLGILPICFLSGNDETVKAFGVSAYPALITVHDNEFEIQEGF